MVRFGPLLVMALAGCSSFQKDWQRCTPDRDSGHSSEIEGCWDGVWQSDVTGHEGTLRCIIKEKQGVLEARFSATYTWCLLDLSFEYALPMTATAERGSGEAYRFQGQAELGCWVAAGTYRYEGRIDHGRYVASYQSSFDHGVFRMNRTK